jgi:hypothetical protein
VGSALAATFVSASKPIASHEWTLSQINALALIARDSRRMSLPFTTDQFLAVFAAYNAAIWPLQIVANALGVLALAALWWRNRFAQRLVLLILALMWALNGVGYHFIFFAPVNPAAKLFAVLFVVQALLFGASALAQDSLGFQIGGDIRSAFGLLVILYSMVIYEALGYAAGHGLMAGPMFGVAPCPTTLFTIGLLMLMRGRLVKWLAVIPLVWAVIGTSAAILLGIREDLGLAAAGMALLIVLVMDFRTGRANLTRPSPMT